MRGKEYFADGREGSGWRMRLALRLVGARGTRSLRSSMGWKSLVGESIRLHFRHKSRSRERDSGFGSEVLLSFPQRMHPSQSPGCTRSPLHPYLRQDSRLSPLVVEVGMGLATDMLR